MSFRVDIDLSDYDRLAGEIKDKMGDLGEVYRQFLDDRVVPKLQSEAGSQRNVITGKYMNDWEAQADGPDSASVITDAYYWVYLENGTSRGIKPKPILPTVFEEVMADMTQYVVESLLSATGVGAWKP